MSTRFLTVGCALLVLSVRAFAADPLVDPNTVDRIVTEALRVWQVPGVAVVVVRGGDTAHLKGYGTKRQGADDPVTPDTLFPLASCTKAFTSTLYAMLADDGKLKWDDPVRQHLPTFHLSDPHADGLVTLRDLLAHRTGVPGHDLIWYRVGWTLDEVVARAAKLPLANQFREYSYSSVMYTALGKAAERGREPWADQVRKRICGPLGMQSAAFTTAEAANARDRPTGHRRTSEDKVEPMPEYRIDAPNAAGSLYLTPRDLAAWLKFQLADGEVNGKRLVSAKNLTETKTAQTVMRKDETVGPVYPDSLQVSYGMGWVVYDHRGKLVVAHGGIIDGFRVQVTLLPTEKVGIVLLNNLDKTKMNIALGNALIDHVCGLPAKDWNAYFLKVEQDERDAKRVEINQRNNARVLGTRPSIPLEKFTGEYEEAAYGIGKVVFTDGQFSWQWSTFRSPLEHFQDNVFRVTEGYFEDHLVEFRVVGGVPDAMRVFGIVFRKK